VKTLTIVFLTHNQSQVKANELSPRTWGDQKDACDAVVSAFGSNSVMTEVGPEEFTPLRERPQDKYGMHGLGKTIQCVRTLLKFGFDAELIAVPMRFGPGFKRPSKKSMRMERIIFSGVAFALLGLGLCMVVWPSWVVLNSRDSDDHRLPSTGEIWLMRVVGVGTVLGCAYGLYAILTGMPGADVLTP
jgi:hypothetical protein